MSTHNIGLYEDLTKIIFELSAESPFLNKEGSFHREISQKVQMDGKHQTASEGAV